MERLSLRVLDQANTPSGQGAGRNTMGTMRRRDVLQIGTVLGAIGTVAPLQFSVAQTTLPRTPEQILGPFYPAGRSPNPGADLTRMPGKPGQAAGQVINVIGRVLNVHGEPVRGARLEIWQANTYGRYTHPADRNPAPIDPNFDGFAVIHSDEEGRYKFKTIKPGAYPTGPHTMRPPHIHFRMTGHEDELVTQLYFDGEPLNDKDPLLQSVAPSRRMLLVAKMLAPPDGFERDSKLVVFDIVTLRG
ncbi:hypothetical protein CJO94_11495 [Ralstonia solanacearum]|nr:hypothetical protein CJO85_11140 [Ralstonia solanacearum]AXW62454.1 hypothetical protein CJO94_11495 [Ralstonia solanacearum]